MDVFAEYLTGIEEPRNRARMVELFDWILKKHPHLSTKIAWNQPMFTDHGTFIIGFSVAKNHLVVTTEPAGIARFAAEIEKAGYEHTKGIFRIPWGGPVDLSLLEEMIAFNIVDKADCPTFFRK